MAENRSAEPHTDPLRPLAGRSAATTVTSRDPAVRDHLVHSVPVLPGVFLLDLVLRLVRRAGIDPARVELRRILFLAPVVGEDEGRRVEVSVGEPASPGGWLPVTLRSRPAGAEGADWETNCQAEIHAHSGPEPEPIDSTALSDAAVRSVGVDELYGFVRGLDIHHTGFMQASGTVRVGDGYALARMRLAAEAEPYLDHFHAHPAVLDFATLVPMLLFGDGQRGSASHAFIPIYIESFHAPGPVAAENLVHVPGPVGGRLDAELFDADLEIRTLAGRLAARLTGFRAKRIRSADLITRRADRQNLPHPAPVSALSQAAPSHHAPEGLHDAVLELVAGRLGSDPARIDPGSGFYELGLTSIDLLGIATALEDRLGEQLYPTLLFEYSTVSALAAHLEQEGHRLGSPVRRAVSPLPAPSATPAEDSSALAVVGLAGRYPGAATADALWDLARDGADRITEIPAERWDHSAHWDPRPRTPGRTYGKWGAFCEGIDEFDAPFFHVPAAQADRMDPHERLFLQTAWEALEDAGHTPEGLVAQTDGAVGVFAGAMWNDYQLHGLDRHREGIPTVAGSWSSSLANRVSYSFDFQGPSLTVDTACSAALTALHLAARSIRGGECRAAVVGGVNLSLHPYKYLRLAELGLLSTDGRSRPFGKDADGYVPGEGVGAVVIRPLADALASGDHVYAVIRGSALRHSGRTGGFSVPGPEAQTRVVSEALAAAGVPARTIGYVEAHGSGTTLGDQIELEALTAAYRGSTQDRGYCAIGSVKTGIGHLEAASGIASLTKVIHVLGRRTIPATRVAGELNPALRFEDTPFYLPGETAPWPTPPADPDSGAPVPRRAGVSAFGAGGANVHLIVEEYERQASPSDPARTYAVPLSARTADQRRTQAERLAAWLAQPGTRPDIVNLQDIAHTLQQGRRPMEYRLVVLASGPDELAAALRDFAAGREGRAGVFSGRAARSAAAQRADRDETVEALAALWVEGRLPSWPPIPVARRLPLPTYPFARERHWLDGVPRAAADPRPGPFAPALAYGPVWEPRALGDSADPRAKTVLAFDTDPARVAELRSRCRRVIQARPGASYARTGQDEFEIAPGSVEHYRELARSLREEGADPDAVLHLWHLRNHPAAVADSTGLMSAYFICQAWATGRRARLPVLFGYLSPGESPALAAVGGLGRSVRLEQPKLALRTVRFTDSPETATLLAEVFAAGAGAGDTEIQYVSAADRRTLGFAPLPPAGTGPSLARDGGVYLITGGAGGLGRHTARHLAAQARVSIALVGRSAPSPATDAAVAELQALGARARYLTADVSDEDALRHAVTQTAGEWGPLTGVIHCAGVIEDALLVNKTGDSVTRVLAPKLRGAVNLDLATRSYDLDYLLLYSSVAAALGSAGGADYAAANRFLDAFAAWREEQRLAGRRRGHTLAVDWPLWRDGGMRPDPEMERSILARTGAEPLETEQGLAALDAALGRPGSRVVLVRGDRERLEQALGTAADAPVARAETSPRDDLLERTTAYVTGLIRESLNGHGPTGTDDEALADEGFMSLGLSSVQLVGLVDRLGRDLGTDLASTLLFRYPDIRSLSAHLAGGYGDAVAAATSTGRPVVPAPAARTTLLADQPVAVIGMSGRFPGRGGLAGLWADLAEGRDLVTPVPADRWDHGRFHDPSGQRPGGTDCGHGAFLDDVARFDARFFGVGRAEAEGTDPQSRLLLEVLYEAAEDAGVAGTLRGSATGSFVGQCFQDYDTEMAAAGREFGAHDVTGTSAAMAANRPSYIFDLTGPSLLVDTACSSSLYALHLAVDALRRGACTMAFAAGTNLILSPQHYLRSSALGALSPSGRCHTFDARADGYVPGESVVAVLLKPLDQALADGDPVHAVIRSVAANHGGRAGSLTAPNPARQSELLLSAWAQAGIDPRSIGYLEAHGTGTALGDPIEVEAAVAAFRRHTPDSAFCALGSAKAHLGHTEAAAGLVGVVKAVLSLRNRLIPAMPDFERLNPHIVWEDGPFFINTEPIPWEPRAGAPRRAGVSSFGFGGAYAHAVLEEAPAPAALPAPERGTLLFPYSATDEGRLRALIRRHRAHLAGHPELRADQVAATLCRGRESLGVRVAVVAESLPELLRHLDAYLDGSGGDRGVLGGGSSDPTARQSVAAAQAWTAGEVALATAPDVPRVPLPTYPFGGEPYWFEEVPAVAEPTPLPAGADGAAAGLTHFVGSGDFPGRRMREAMDGLDALLRRWCHHLLGGVSNPSALRARLADEAEYGRLADALAGVVARASGGPATAEGLRAETVALAARHPELTPWTELVLACVPRLPEMLDGSADALEVYFAGDRSDLLPRIYDGNPVADHHNELVAQAAAAQVRAVHEREPGRFVRVMEIGGGTGGTTRRVLEILAGDPIAADYTFTDVSPAFLPAARARFAEALPTFRTAVLDLNQDPAEQGFEAGRADVIIAANSVHATSHVAASLSRIRGLLAPGGMLILEELVRNRDCMTAMIGALPGYWSSVDPDVRLPHSPFLDVPGWRAALAEQGFERTCALGAPDLDETEFDNAVLLSSVPVGTAERPAAVRTVPLPVASVPVRTAPSPAPARPAAGWVRDRLRGVFARFFGRPAEEIDVRATFDTFGMDSLSAIQLVRTLEPDFGRLPKVLLYEHPTLDALADHLTEHALRLPQAEAVPEPVPVAQPTLPGPADDSIAIVGMAGRFAQSPDLATWWGKLRDGVHLVTEIPQDRFDWRGVYGDPHRTLGKVNSRWGSFLSGVDHFDAEFFGISPLEAELMDPQQRLMLETAWKAVEDSGHRPGDLRGSRTGVFVGATSHDYDWQLDRAGRYREGHVVSGNGHCLIANRISYQLDLRGPSEAIDTACSSSLTALHRAVRSIKGGECDAAVVGGVHVFLNEDLFVALGQLGIMSPDGRCSAFDKRANGMVRGEGAVAVLLKPLSRALADGDTVYALVRGSGVSHGGGGHMGSLMMPNPAAQAELIASVYRDAGVDPRSIGYIEAHGTGTEVGDPIELRGLRRAFSDLTGLGDNGTTAPWCGVGTVKSNVGHTEAAAGLTGLVKTVLALWHGELPPTLHFTEPNPLLEIDDSPFYVVDRRTPWPGSGAGPRRAGVSAFGLGGTNAHVLLEEYVPPAEPGPRPTPGPGVPQVVQLSARNEERLRAYARQLAHFVAGFQGGRDTREDPEPVLADLAYTLRVGRDAMAHRLALVARTTGELSGLLGDFLAGRASNGVLTGHAVSTEDDAVAPEDDPHTAARQWVNGGAAWRPPGEGRAPRRMSLPTYPFEPRRHWAEPRAVAEDSPQALSEALRALSEGRISVDEAEQLMEGVS
jgi:acyl transferase domain-containing protein/acyl carrier protein